ncbi:hypothetical protein BC938DRAFT_480214 [Jimgerdemannia flammicorona]|uniref:Uncharacterized protein n=1 Tax=Jimgerdemannia flammicorona TaxID=994334 RepID=A0A433QJ07_9FUNG|nr:hypothetical protein BC938DRAFT_480214 [Jimgerdemannia flammicorona]
MNALLSLSDPDYRPEPQQQPSAPAPAPAPAPTFTLEPPQPLLQNHQAGHAVAPKERVSPSY